MTWKMKCLTKLNRMKKSILIFALCIVNYAYAQQKENIIFSGATIHIGNGELIENGIFISPISLLQQGLSQLHKFDHLQLTRH